MSVHADEYVNFFIMFDFKIRKTSFIIITVVKTHLLKKKKIKYYGSKV